MTLARVLPFPLAKEVQALLPVWLGCLAALMCLAAARSGGVFSDGGIEAWGLLLYGVASVALGALSIGHEYTHRTLPLLLSHPSSRAHILLLKGSVLAVMLLTLAAAEWGTVVEPSNVTVQLFVLSVLSGLFVAPWLTMLCRNPLAGAVFTGPMLGLLWLLVDTFVSEPMKLVAFGWGAAGFCAVAAVLGWRTFMRLEAIEGRGADLQWPTATGRLAPGRSGAPIWLLVTKELGLQQLAYAVTGAYLLGWLISLWSGPGEHGKDIFGALTVLSSGQLALLIGSQASAGERQLGTHDWQALLPMASWKQWMVKVATVAALSLILTVGLPALLLSVSDGAIRINEWFILAMLLLTTAGLYVSSLSRSGVRALLVSLPVSLFVLWVAWILSSGLRWRLTPLPLALLMAFIAIALYFALLNHRSSERGIARVALQVFVMTGCLAFAAALLTLTLAR